MKRILLLYTFDFSGHHKACLALRRALRAADPSVATRVRHFLDFVHPGFRRWADAAYFGLVASAPGLWGNVYDRPVGRAARWAIGRASAAAEPGFDAMFATWRPDLVVCTQALPCIAVSEYKRKRGAAFEIAGVLTDYHPHRFWAEAREASFVVPSEYARAALEASGVDASRIRGIGMPIEASFGAPPEGGRAAARRELGLAASLPHLLVMGGSRGFVDASRILTALETEKPDFQITFLTGKNRELFERLSRRAPLSPKRVRVMPYVSGVERWLRASDAVITKAGGLSVSEAIACGVPAILTGSLPGQEEFNARLLADNRSVFRANSAEEACRIAAGILGGRGGARPEPFSTSAEIARGLLAVS